MTTRTKTIYRFPTGANTYDYYVRSADGRNVKVLPADYERLQQQQLLGRLNINELNAPAEMIAQINQTRTQQAASVGKGGGGGGCPEGSVLIDLGGGPQCIDADAFGEGGGGTSFASTRESAEFDAQQRAAEAAADFERQKQLLIMQQQFQAEQDRIQREAAEKARVESLKQERLQIFTDLMGKDPVRAVLFAMGIGGETTQLPTEKFAELAPLQGATEKKAETEQALTGLFKSPTSGVTQEAGPVTLSGEGVGGLVTAEQSAKLLAQGDENTKKLLASAYGVGGPTTGRAGISAEELVRRAQSVTPKGVLRSA